MRIIMQKRRCGDGVQYLLEAWAPSISSVSSHKLVKGAV
jgi:hypothetical protein